MWTCERCGETHEDQFTACWKCAGADRPRAPEQPPPTVRGTSVVVRATVVGLLLGLVVGPLLPLSLPDVKDANRLPSALIALPLGLVGGALAGAAIGAALWALFPYRDDR